MGTFELAFTGLGTFTSHDISGGFAGGTIGYNWQMNPNWVFGLEGVALRQAYATALARKRRLRLRQRRHALPRMQHP
jgi:hypothetical protein